MLFIAHLGTKKNLKKGQTSSVISWESPLTGKRNQQRKDSIGF